MSQFPNPNLLQLVYVTPLLQEGGISTKTHLNLVFNHAIKAGSGKITIFSSTSPRVVILEEDIASSSRIQISGNILSFDLPDTLPAGAQLWLDIPSYAVINAQLHYDELAIGATIPFQVEHTPAPAQLDWSGTDANDTEHGSDSADTLSGGAGNDALYGHGGNDVLRGGIGDQGGSGDDLLAGMDGDDTLYGEDGSDSLHGGTGNDSLYGGTGNDRLDGELGDDVLYGGDGNDHLTSESRSGSWSEDLGADQLHGEGGDDTISVRTMRASVVHGGDGNDTINVASGSHTAYGGAGNDILTASDTSDSTTPSAMALHGGAGADRLHVLVIQEGDAVEITTGEGSDEVLVYTLAGSVLVHDFTAGSGGDRIRLNELFPISEGNPFGAAAHLKMQQVGADTVIYFDADGTGSRSIFIPLMTLKGVDLLTLTAANFVDNVDPTGAADGQVLDGTAGDDAITGGFLNDHITGGLGADTLKGEGGADSIHGGEGKDSLEGGKGNDLLYGDAGNDVLVDLDGDNKLYGGDGDDTLITGAGEYILDGGTGNDTLEISTYSNGGYSWPNTVVALGGDDNDSFSIRFDNDRPATIDLTGGAGTDTYSLASLPYYAQVTITDFSTGQGGDQVSLEHLLGPGYPGGNPFGAIAILRLVQSGADTLLMFDPDGTRGLREATEVVRFSGVQVSSFTSANFVGGISPTGSEVGLVLGGTSASDTLVGGFADDTLIGDAGNDVLRGGLGNDLMVGGEGNDDINDDHGVNRMEGGAGDDGLKSNGGAGIMDGGDGNDSLTVTMTGNAVGNVTLLGGTGADSFAVRGEPNAQGAVTATGGPGQDSYLAANLIALTSYTVTDFAAGAGGDFIDLSNLVAQFNTSRNPFSTGQMALVQSGDDTLVSFSLAGDASDLHTILRLQDTRAGELTAANFSGAADPQAIATPSSILGEHHTRHVAGTSANDVLTGSAGNDFIDGGAGNDTLVGLDGWNLLRGGAGNDKFVVGTELNHLSGGAGNDTAVFQGKYYDYDIRFGQLGAEVQHRTQLQNQAMMDGIERLAFADTGFAFDTSGEAGQIYRLYVAAFKRVPDQVGMGYWLSRSDNGASLVQMAHEFMSSPEFSSSLGGAVGDANVVTALYNNVLRRAPDAGGMAFWTDLLGRKVVSLGEVLVSFSESQEFQADVADLIGASIQYVPFNG